MSGKFNVALGRVRDITATNEACSAVICPTKFSCFDNDNGDPERILSPFWFPFILLNLHDLSFHFKFSLTLFFRKHSNPNSFVQNLCSGLVLA